MTVRRSRPAVPPAATGVAAAALLIAGVTVAARLLGFVRVVVFARAVGPSCLGDTYSTANAIPNIVFDVVAGGALSSLVVPVLAAPVDRGDAPTVDRTASALLTWAATLLVPVTVAGALLAHPLMHLLVGSGHPACSASRQLAVGARMLVVFMPQVLLYGVGIVLTGVVQAHRRFLGPALGPLLSSLVVIAAYLTFAAAAGHRETALSTSSGAGSLPLGHELLLSVGTTLGVVALVTPLLIPVARTGVRLRPNWRFPPGVAATVRRMAVSGALVLGSQQLATAVMLRLANDRGSDGSVVLYTLGWTVFLLPWSIIAVPLATSIFPTLVAQWQGGDRLRYAEALARTIRVVLMGAAGAGAAMAAAAGPLARLVILGAPGAAAPTVLARALVGFAPGVVGFALVAVLSRALYAQNDSRTPATAVVAGWALAVAADITLVAAMPRSWAVTALGIGTSLGVTLAGGWLLVAIRRTAGARALAAVGRAGAAAVSAAVLAGLAGGGVSLALAGGPLPHSLLAAVLALAVTAVGYAGLVGLLDRPTLALLASRIRRRHA